MPNYGGCDCGGEHYTTGDRAWCLDCSEWCYAGEGMQCEIAVLRSQAAATAELVAAARDSLLAGAHDGPCDNEDDQYEACSLHVAAASGRRERLERALEPWA